MKVVYVAGPYRNNTVLGTMANIDRARKVAMVIWKMGYVAVCPHTNSALFDEVTHESVFLKGYLELVKRCDVVVVVPNYHESEGTLAEIEVALLNGIPVIRFPDGYDYEAEEIVVLKELIDAKRTRLQA